MLPPARGRIHASPSPASLPAAVRRNDFVSSHPGVAQAQFPVLFPRNVERDLVADENRRDPRWFLERGRCHNYALKEWTRDRVPLDWAMSFGNEGVALMLLAERRQDAAVAKTALSQINTAFETMRDGSHAPCGAYYEEQLPRARAIAARLRTVGCPAMNLPFVAALGMCFLPSIAVPNARWIN